MSELEGVSYFADRRRIQQPRAKIAEAAAPEHQRGMRSFLTWSFLLAQIAAAEQIAGSAAAAAATDPSSSTRASGDSAPAAAALPDDASQTAASNADAGERGSPLAASAAVAPSNPSAASAATPAASPLVGDTIGTSDPSAVGVGVGAGHHAAGGNLPGHENVVGLAADILPGSLAAVGGDVAVNLGLGTLGGLGIELGLDDGVALDLSALGLDIHVDVPLDIGSLLGTVTETVGTVLTTAGDLTGPVLDVVGDVSGPATEAVGTVLATADELSGPVLDVVADISGPATETVGTVLTTAADLTGPVLDAFGDSSLPATPVLDGMQASVDVDGSSSATGGGGLLSALGGAVGSSGTIELTSETTGGGDASEALLEGSTYTDLGIAYQTLLPDQPPTAASIEGTAGAAPAGGLLETVVSSGVTTDGDTSNASIGTSEGLAAALGLEDAVGGHRTLADLFG